MEEAWKYIEMTDCRFDQSNISLEFSVTFFKANQDTKAWKHVKIALDNASYVGDRVQVARALTYMGLRKGD